MTRALGGTNVQVSAATLLLLLALLPGRELIPVMSGLGVDGIIYADWTRRLSIEMLLSPTEERPHSLQRSLNSYHVRRVLVPVSLHYLLGWLDVEANTPSVVRTYTVLNILCLTLAAWLWCLAADALSIGVRGKWLGFLALTVNCANAKMSLFRPVLLDSVAMLFGSAMLLCYLKGWRARLMVLTLLGAGVWPSLPFFGLLLIAFPRSEGGPTLPAPHHLDRVVAIAVAVVSLALITWVIGSGHSLANSSVEPFRSAFPVSTALVVAYLYLGVRPLMDSKRLWADLAPRRLLAEVWPWAALFVYGSGVFVLGKIPVSTGRGSLRAIADNFLTAVVQPGVAWVAHPLYYGPLVLLLLLLWRPISESIRRQGTGLILCFVLAVILGAGSESRKLINFYPVIALFMIQVAEPLFATRARMLAIAGLSVLFSRIWLPMNETLTLPVWGDLDWLRLYRQGDGPWMNHAAWLAQGLLVLATLAWLYACCRRRPRRPS